MFNKQTLFDFKHEIKMFPFAKMVNSSNNGTLLQFKRGPQIAISFHGLVFLNVKGNITICSPDLAFKCLSVSP